MKKEKKRKKNLGSSDSSNSKTEELSWALSTFEFNFGKTCGVSFNGLGDSTFLFLSFFFFFLCVCICVWFTLPKKSYTLLKLTTKKKTLSSKRRPPIFSSHQKPKLISQWAWTYQTGTESSSWSQNSASFTSMMLNLEALFSCTAFLLKQSSLLLITKLVLVWLVSTEKDKLAFSFFSF